MVGYNKSTYVEIDAFNDERSRYILMTLQIYSLKAYYASFNSQNIIINSYTFYYAIKKAFRAISSAFSSAVILIYFIKDFSVVWPVMRIMDIEGMPALYIFVAAERRAVWVVITSHLGHQSTTAR